MKLETITPIEAIWTPEDRYGILSFRCGYYLKLQTHVLHLEYL